MPGGQCPLMIWPTNFRISRTGTPLHAGGSVADGPPGCAIALWESRRMATLQGAGSGRPPEQPDEQRYDRGGCQDYSLHPWPPYGAPDGIMFEFSGHRLRMAESTQTVA